MKDSENDGKGPDEKDQPDIQFVGEDIIGAGIPMPVMPNFGPAEPVKHHRVVTVKLPSWPMAGGKSAEHGPIITIDLTSEGSEILIEASVEGKVHDAQEYYEVMKLIKRLV